MGDWDVAIPSLINIDTIASRMTWTNNFSKILKLLIKKDEVC